jgi:thioredoxin reductase (NADPH)
MEDTVYDVIVIGGGPAGLAAALYTARSRLMTLVIEKAIVGGELMNRDIIENYPGYPEGIYGPELGSKLVKQVKNLGVKIEIAEALGVEGAGDLRLVKTTEGNYLTRALLIATGTHHKRLGVPGEEEFLNRGVFYCATCDGPAYVERKVAVVGGGDSGVTEALFLSRIGAKVTLLEVLPSLTAQRLLQERVKADPAIEVRCGKRVERIVGDEEVREVEIVDVRTGQKEILAVEGVLVQIGLEPNTEFLGGLLKTDETRRIVVDRHMQTSMSLVFAAGDVRSESPGQIVTAMGDGATAAIAIQRALQAF